MIDSRPKSANQKRLGTAAQQQTALKELNYSGVGYNTKVTSVDRPITQHGMAGVAPNSAAKTSRQIYDRNYYANQLKQKNQMLQIEIHKLKLEGNLINRDNGIHMALERKFDVVIRDVRRLEGDLADYNLALDKLRSDTQASDIEAMALHIKNSNDKQRAHLDALFAEKRDLENEIHQYEHQVQQIQLASEINLNELDLDQRTEYNNLKKESMSLQAEIQTQRQNLDEVSSRLIQSESYLQTDTLKQRAMHLKDEKAILTKQKEDLELQTSLQNLPFIEAREKLMTRIKQDNIQIKEQEKDLFDSQKITANYTKTIKDITDNLNGKTQFQIQAEEGQKYEILYQKEKEINEFQIFFEKQKREYDSSIADNQHVIKAILEHTQKVILRQNKLPSPRQVEEIKKDLEFKQKELKNSESTAAKLMVQVQARQADIDKIQGLEQRMQIEMDSVQEGIIKMEHDMDHKFCKTDEIQDSFQDYKSRSLTIRFLILNQKNLLRSQTLSHSIKHDTKQNQLAQNEIYTSLNEAEKRLIENESQIYSIQKYIETKNSESNYQGMFQNCMNHCEVINNEVVRKSLLN